MSIKMVDPALNNLIKFCNIEFYFTRVLDPPLEKGNWVKDAALVDILSEHVPLDLSRH